MTKRSSNPEPRATTPARKMRPRHGLPAAHSGRDRQGVTSLATQRGLRTHAIGSFADGYAADPAAKWRIKLETASVHQRTYLRWSVAVRPLHSHSELFLN